MIRAWCALAFASAACAVPLHGAEPSVVELQCEDGQPCCNAFAVQTHRGPKLVTAAHCLRGLDSARFLRFGGGLSDVARVTFVDLKADVAELEAPAGMPLLLTASTAVGASPVWAQQAWQARAGQVIGTGGRFYVTTLPVAPGWSGSPVLDTEGRAVGVLVRCTAGDDRHGKSCAPRSGIFVALPH